MKKINIILLILIGLVTALILYFSREIFFFRYDAEYFENYYYNSQWNVPQSTRGISDGELYKFVGFQLANGENPFNINFEVPPLAKYLYGLAEKTVGNPYWISLGFFFLTGLTIYLLCLELFKNRTTALFGLLLCVTTPFLATQIRETMLDLPLTSLFLFNALFFVKFLKRHKLKDLVIAGVFLGLATGTKIGVYSPLLLLLGLTLSLIVSSKKILNTIFYLGSVFGGYVLSFFCYFIKHPNPIPWLRLHEKPLNFYLQSGVDKVDYLNQWRGIFLNSYKGFWVGATGTGLGDWSIILPLGVILAITIFVIALKKKDFSLLYLTIFTFIILGINTIIPFWARYLMPIVPLFIIFILYAFKKRIPILFLLVILNLLLLFPIITKNDLTGHAGAVSRFLNTRAYRELYRSIDSETRNNIPEAKFISSMESFYVSLKVKKIEVTITEVVDTQNTHQGKLNTKYFTDYGEISNTQEINFLKVHNQWKTVWKWDYLLPGFSPDKKIEINEKIDTTQKVRQAVYVIPRLMYDWGRYTSALSALTKMSDNKIDGIIRESIPDDFPRFVGYLNPELDKDTIERNTLPGISIKEEKVYSPETTFRINQN
ncbi:MAG TPA: glycosyltransferase family 39 protein [Candidatus Woesebacteria bacterium]|nr:glycosyltransferase family 39 protein [Candidatus Woesebacteria bacterium]